jgi:diaminopimelate epimerase
MDRKNFFVKSHGLGNEYIVFDSSNITFDINTPNIEKICNIHFGIGSDGILLVESSSVADFKFRVFNPDGSEAEKSGNGLRIFAKYIFDYGYTCKRHFTIETMAGIVEATINKEHNGKAEIITIDIGKAIFEPKNIPVKCDLPECIDFPLTIDGKTFKINCISVGNPHCVIVTDILDEQLVKEFGPKIENHPMFPNRINVQFVKVLSDKAIQMLIWERGAGFTLASGSSSSAAATMMHKKGLVGKEIDVNMLGGQLHVSVDNDWNIRLCGEVQQVAEGWLSEEYVESLIKNI